MSSSRGVGTCGGDREPAVAGTATWDLDVEIGEGPSLRFGESAYSVGDPVEQLAFLCRHRLEGIEQRSSVQQKGCAWSDVAEALGVLSEGGLSAGADIFDD